MEVLCGFLVGLIAGFGVFAWVVSTVDYCIPCQDKGTGNITAHWRGKNYELVRLLGNKVEEGTEHD